MPSVKLQFGPMLLGVMMNMVLYGVLIVQCYHYYQTYKKDAPWIKLLVLYLFVVESINTGCDIYIIYQPLIERFGSPDAQKYFPTLFAAEPITIVAISTPIQLFFAWRIWVLTKSKALSGVICSLALASFGKFYYLTSDRRSLFARKAELHTPALVWFLTACCADVLITVTLVFTLQSKKTGFVATDDAISRIIRMTVQTGMITAICAIGDVVFFMTLPKTALNFLWDLALAKLYANCLLSTLNARASLADSSRSSSNYLSSQGRQMVSGGPVRMRTDASYGAEPMSPHIISNPMYELEEQKTYADHNSDVEYGITITKVVETRQDMAPHNRRDHTQ
ncbi:hypothetical protein CPB83DRAFT_897990 [Crepidotus variabilis]|uniref:DUF6534 domain-containing protein n=1 Tax=Crepidotus variabilis TaxID=179855 RepID=A0A9P6E8B6_9AGAR|nr:hypothetical protein CPB83DRAFT_897990 [Crepidotus variabilis]